MSVKCFVYFSQDIYERLCFTVEWFQVEAGLTHNYTFIYFPNDNSVEMVRTIRFASIIIWIEYVFPFSLIVRRTRSS